MPPRRVGGQPLHPIYAQRLEATPERPVALCNNSIHLYPFPRLGVSCSRRPVYIGYPQLRTKESDMEKPREGTTVATAPGGDELRVIDQLRQANALNTTSAR